MSGKRKGKKKGNPSRSRRFARRLGWVVLLLCAALGVAGDWFVHQPRAWREEVEARFPGFLLQPLYAVGEPVGDITDALGWTGHDAVYEYDLPAPAHSILFAGPPRRVGPPAPADIEVLPRGQFLIGWSPSLRHPVWCAYHVRPEAKYASDRRKFLSDKSLPTSPSPQDYERSGYDRGHMVPNHAIVTRYGREAQRNTFLMSNIAPQRPGLNRGVWRNVEHRIADLWTARYGEIWVVVGCISSPNVQHRLRGTSIDIPTHYYQLVVAQEGVDVRAMAMIFPQDVDWDAYPTRYLVSIDELEKRTGLDFLTEMPDFITAPLEADLPTRLWPIRVWDVFHQLGLNHVN